MCQTGEVHIAARLKGSTGNGGQLLLGFRGTGLYSSWWLNPFTIEMHPGIWHIVFSIVPVFDIKSSGLLPYRSLFVTWMFFLSPVKNSFPKSICIYTYNYTYTFNYPYNFLKLKIIVFASSLSASGHFFFMMTLKPPTTPSSA